MSDNLVTRDNVAFVITSYRLWFLLFLWNTQLWANQACRPAHIRIMEVCDSFSGLFHLWLLAIIPLRPFLSYVLHVYNPRGFCVLPCES